MGNDNSQFVRLVCDFRFAPASISATTANFLNQRSANKRFLIEEGLNNLFYPEALIYKSDPLTKQETYQISKAIQALESQLVLYRQFYQFLNLSQPVSDSSILQLDKVQESAVENAAKIEKEFHSFDISMDDQADSNDDIDEDNIDFSDSGI